jgi:hypothetical protein
MLLLGIRNELSKKAFEPMSAGSYPNSRIPNPVDERTFLDRRL